MARTMLRRQGTLTSLAGAVIAACVGLSPAETALAATTPSPPAPSATTTTGSGAHLWAYENEDFVPHAHTLASDVAAAKRFDLIIALPETFATDVKAMHAANPHLVLINYMQGTYALPTESTKYPASWYMYDKNHKKVTNDYHLWMMDIGNPAWVSQVGTICASQLAQSHYDGCFLDNLGSGTLKTPLSAKPINPRTGQVWTNKQWMSATTIIAKSVKAKQGSKPVLCNGLVNGSYYFDSTAPTKVLLTTTGRAMAETFIRTAGDSLTSYRPVSSWLSDVKMVADAGKSGGRINLVTKTWVTGTTAQIEQWHRFAMASFLLGANSTAVFTFRPSRLSDPLAPDALAPKVAAIGAPSAAYSAVGNAYQRPFTNGKVIVNPQSTAVTVALGGTFHTIDGRAVTSLTLKAHSGEILSKG